MNEDVIDKVSYTAANDDGEPITSLMLRFSGLGAQHYDMYTADYEKPAISAGALLVVPFHNPWAWMNARTVAFVDDLIDALIARHNLDPKTPIVATGGSMGGHAALAFTMNSRHVITGCVANCAPADLVFSYGERPDLPKTLHDSVGSYGDITDLLIANSPVHQAKRMPVVPYLIIHGGKDEAVSKVHHSDVLVRKLKGLDFDVRYIEIPEMGHCGPLTADAEQAIADFLLRSLQR